MGYKNCKSLQPFDSELLIAELAHRHSWLLARLAAAEKLREWVEDADHPGGCRIHGDGKECDCGKSAYLAAYNEAKK